MDKEEKDIHTDPHMTGPMPKDGKSNRSNLQELNMKSKNGRSFLPPIQNRNHFSK